MLAGFVALKTDWCWPQWDAWQHPEKAWALGELSRWIVAGDDAPECVRRAMAAAGTEGPRPCSRHGAIQSVSPEPAAPPSAIATIRCETCELESRCLYAGRPNGCPGVAVQP